MAIKKNKEVKLKISDIKKNPNIEREHIITKIKKHERFYSFCLSMTFIIAILLITFIVGTSFRKILSINSFNSGDLEVEYNTIDNNIGNIVTLTDENVQPTEKVLDQSMYNFTITNNSKETKKYQIILVKDKDFIKLDKCENKIFKDSSILYNINKGKERYIKDTKEKDYYILQEDIIQSNSTKVYSINFWIDNNTKLEERHYHGIIEVNMVR